MKNNDGSPANFKDINDMLHIFFVRHLNNTNDPNTATNLLEYGEKDKQMEFLKIQADAAMPPATKEGEEGMEGMMEEAAAE